MLCGVVLHTTVHLIFPRAAEPSLTVTARHSPIERESLHLQGLYGSLFSSSSGNTLVYRHSLSIFEDSVLKSFFFHSQVVYDFSYCRGDPFLNFIFPLTVASVQKLLPFSGFSLFGFLTELLIALIFFLAGCLCFLTRA